MEIRTKIPTKKVEDKKIFKSNMRQVSYILKHNKQPSAKVAL